MKTMISVIVLFWAGILSAAPADNSDCFECVEARDNARKPINENKLKNRAAKIKNIPPAVREVFIAQAQAIEDQAQAIADLQAYVELLQAYIEIDEETDVDRPVVRIVSANLQVVNGNDDTYTTNGTGNLIIGYNTAIRREYLENCDDGAYLNRRDCLSAGGNWGNNWRSGSHNLIVGDGHSYSQAGGLVAGLANVINRNSASVSGGRENHASGFAASVNGGSRHLASATGASVSGGKNNTASDRFSSVSGGFENRATGSSSSVSGGNSNTASAPNSSICGGERNLANGNFATVSGGRQNRAIGFGSSVTGGESNSAIGNNSTVGGGLAGRFSLRNQWGLGASP